MITVVVSNCQSTPTLAVISKVWLMSVSICDHTAWLLAGGHLICFCLTTLQRFEGCGAWRDWALWGDSWPGSPRSDPVHCCPFSCSLHFILDRCILRSHWFLHTLLHCYTTESVLVGAPVFLPFGLPWGYISECFFVAILGFFPHGKCISGW